MRLYVRVCDIPPGHLVEGGFDYFRIKDTLDFDFVENVWSVQHGIKGFPNPAADVLTLHLTDYNTPVQAYITDVTGRRLQSFTLTQAESSIHIADLSSGIYFIFFQFKDKQVPYRFIKE
jgi:hypothetical protein